MMSNENMVSRVLRAPLLIFEFNFTFTYQNSVGYAFLLVPVTYSMEKLKNFCTLQN